MGKPIVVGRISKKVIEILGIALKVNMPILLGDQNQIHMESEHPEDYKKYFGYLQEILEHPDYVAKHPRKDSIEYIKIFHENDGDHVLVAVRISNQGTLFARTLFVMSEEKIRKYQEKGALLHI